ncbi:MAG: hypothetical protein RI894_2342, partial [Bacteroidota bacterium]
MNKFLLFFALTLASATAWAQQTILKGIVSDAKEPLVGATVTVAKTTTATSTDADGKYELPLTAGTYNIEFSYVGYDVITKKITIKNGEIQVVDVKLGETPSVLQTVTVTSGKFAKPLGEVTVSLEVIKPSLIENSSSSSIDKAIDKVPGVNIVDGQANIRGGSGWSYGAGSRVLLLVNDLPALQGDAGLPNWNDIPVENIEQVEIVKGASSALYGSSALNGIINIRTAFAKTDPITKFATFATAYDAPKLAGAQWWGDSYVRGKPYEIGFSLAHRQKFGKFDLAVGSFYKKNESFRKGENTDYARFNTYTRYRFSENLSAGVNFNVNKGKSTSFFLWNGDSTKSLLPLIPLGSKDPILTNSEVLRFSLDPYVTYIDKNANTHKILTRLLHVSNKNIANDGTDQSNTSDYMYGEYQFSRNFENLELTTVAGIVGSSTTTFSPLFSNALITSSNLAAYLQVDKKFHLVKGSKWHNLSVSGGARYESNTLKNPRFAHLRLLEVNPTDTVFVAAKSEQEAKPVFRAGINYQPAEFTFIRASWGQGYRYPTVAEKFIQTKLGGLLWIDLNENLKSETGWSAEIGVKQGLKISNWRGFLDASVFTTEYQNMMEFTFGGTNLLSPILGFSSTNIGDTRVSGFDITLAGEGKILGKNTQALIGYTYIDPVFLNWTKINRAFDSIPTNRPLTAGEASYFGSASANNVLKYRFRHTAKADIETSILPFLAIGASWNFLTNVENVDNVFVAELGQILAPGYGDYKTEK